MKERVFDNICIANWGDQTCKVFEYASTKVLCDSRDTIVYFESRIPKILLTLELEMSTIRMQNDGVDLLYHLSVSQNF